MKDLGYDFALHQIPMFFLKQIPEKPWLPIVNILCEFTI
jgi:hypothetical protein